jgi:peptide/nickel transport system permease protein
MTEQAAPPRRWASGEVTRELLHTLRHDPVALAALAWLIFVIGASFVGVMFLKDASLKQDLDARLVAPGLDGGFRHLLGTDGLGRSYVERLLVAGGTSLLVALTVVVLAATAGAVLGVIAGMSAGVVDTLIMRFCDIVMAFPSMLLALVALYTLSPSVVVLAGVLAVTRLPIYVRAARGEALRTRNLLYIKAAEISGTKRLRIMSRHVLRATLPAIWTLATFEISITMLTESGLSFLGVGIQPPGTSWGLLVADGQTYLSTAWWVAVLPGALIMTTAVALRSVASVVRTVLEGY